MHRRGPYAIARDWIKTPPDCRAYLSDHSAADYDQICHLEPEWGRELDDLGATYRMVRWVAQACGPASLAQRQARYHALVAFLKGGGSGEKAFRRLRESLPKVGRAAARERREREEQGR